MNAMVRWLVTATKWILVFFIVALTVDAARLQLDGEHWTTVVAAASLVIVIAIEYWQITGARP